MNLHFLPSCLSRILHQYSVARAFQPSNMTAAVAGLLLTLWCAGTMAHNPLFDCYDNQDGTITCEGGFSDGSSAQGIMVRVMDQQGKLLAEAPLDEDNSVSFERPTGNFSVVFTAGAEHSITVYSDDIY